MSGTQTTTIDPRTAYLHDPAGTRGGARNVGPDARAPMLNPNTSFQPTVGASTTPTEDRLLGLQVEQAHAHAALGSALGRLRSTLEESSPESLAALESTLELLEAGGNLEALEAGIADYESELAYITPTLIHDDLAALNSVLTSTLYIVRNMRTVDTLPALPVAEEDPDKPGQGPHEEPTPTPTPAPTPAGF